MTKAVAKALYIELRKFNHTAQIVLVPPMQVGASGNFDPMRLLSRQVSTGHPRRAWRFYKSPTASEVYENPALETATIQATPFIKDIEHYFRGFRRSGWNLYKTPVAVEMTYDDIKEIQEGNTPQAFMRRLTRARLGAEYSEELFNEAL